MAGGEGVGDAFPLWATGRADGSVGAGGGGAAWAWEPSAVMADFGKKSQTKSQKKSGEISHWYLGILQLGLQRADERSLVVNLLQGRAQILVTHCDETQR